METCFDEKVVVISASPEHAEALHAWVEPYWRNQKHVNGFGQGDISGRHIMWIRLEVGTSAIHFQEMVPASIAGVETVEGVIVKPIRLTSASNRQIEELARRINCLTDVETAYAVGEMLKYAVVIPKKGTNVRQLKRSLEALAKKMK